MTAPEKRDEILQAALELIAEHGFHGTTMAMIAERAKVGAGTIYRYFESKDVLIFALFKDVEQKIGIHLRKNIISDEPSKERYIKLFSSLLKYLINNPIYFSYIEQFVNSPYGIEHRRDKIVDNKAEGNLFREMFEKGVTDGEIKDFPVVVLFSLSFGPIMALVRDHNLGFFTLDDGLIEQVTRACWDAIKVN